MDAILNRYMYSDEGTFGHLTLDDGTTFYSVELPWRDNKHDLSCIMPAPGGIAKYLCTRINSPKHGNCFLVNNTPDRAAVEIHMANFGGDVTQGMKSDLLGCIALGTDIGKLNVPGYGDQMAVLHSTDAIAQFMNKQSDVDEFYLTIEG